jgi:desulfoferrodoxin (superoxide reductase-like protein)
MKRTLFIMIVLLNSMLLTLSAHAPKKVVVEYNTETAILKVDIPHPVKNVDTHYIEKIVISVNDEEVKEIEYTSQSSLEAHTVEIEIPGIKKGSVVKVSAKCNKLGTKSGSVTVE